MVRNAFFDLLDGAWPTLIIFIVIIVILRVFYIKNTGKKFILHEELILLLSVTYILLLFELVTSRDVSLNNGYNLVPFREILRYQFGSNGFYRQVVGNILIFIPFGFFATYYTKISKIRNITFMTFLVSLTIETVQKFIGRSFDIDDIILNVIGGIAGFLVYVALDAIRKKLPSMFQKDGFYNFLSILLVVVLVLYLLGIINLW